MRKMTEKQLKKWEQSRDIGQEILQGMREIKAGRIGRRYTTESFPIVRAREKSGLSQAKFAELLECRFGQFKTGSKGGESPMPRPRH